MSAVTRVIYVVDGTTVNDPVFNFTTIDLLDLGVITVLDQMAVYRRRVGNPLQVRLTAGIDYTIDGVTKIVTIDVSVGLAVGDVIIIKRETPIGARQIDFEGLTYLNSDIQNTNSDNLLHLVQEVNSETGIALRRSADLTRWDGEALEVANAAPGTSGSSLATLSQVQNLIAGADTAEVGISHFFVAVTNGTTDRWILPGFPRGDTSPEKITVFLDGVQQEPTRDYTYGYLVADGDPHIEFTTVPSTNMRLNVRGISGQVQVVVVDDSLNGASIINGSIGSNKLGFAAGAARRFPVVTTSGAIDVRVIDKNDIGNFDASVRTSRLDQMAPPNADINLVNNKLLNVTAGSAALDGVNKGQMDAADGAAITAAVAAAQAGMSASGIVSFATAGTETVPLNFTPRWVRVRYVAVVAAGNNIDSFASGLPETISTSGTFLTVSVSGNNLVFTQANGTSGRPYTAEYLCLK